MTVRRRLALLLLLTILTAAAPASAKGIFGFLQPSREPAPVPEVPAAASIPVPEVAQRAEEATKVLRDVDALLVPGPGVMAIQQRLPEIDARLAEQTVSTNRQIDEGASGATLDTLTTQWQSVRAEVATYVNVLAERATALERSLERLSGLGQTWTQARTDARASRAPAPVVGRIEGILTAIGQTRTRLQQERAATLVLQDRVAQAVARCDDVLGRLATARKDVARRFVTRDGVPLWRTEQLSGAVTELPTRVREAAHRDIAELRQVTQEQQARIYGTIALCAGLGLLMYLARRTAKRAPPPAGMDVSTLAPLERPVAVAVLLAVIVNAFGPPVARVAQVPGEMLVLVATLRVIRVTIDPRLLPMLTAFSALLLADLVRRLASAVPLLEQQIFLLEALAVIVLLGVALLRPGRWKTVTSGEWHRTVRIAATVALVAFTVAGVAAAAGYLRVALFLGAGTLGSIYVALVLYAIVKVVGALTAVALISRPFRDLRMVQRHRSLLERRIGGVLRLVAIAGWVVLVLRHFHLWSSAVALAQAALGAELQGGSLTVSVAGVLVFVIALVATFALSAIVRFVLQEEIYPRVVPGRVLPYAVSSLVHYALVVAGFLLGLAALGVDLTKITIVAGALGVGIGFGLQGLVNNFVSGLILLSERRINVGDAVQIGDVSGRVQQLGIRACMVRTWDGAEVIVPNASLVTEKVTNWTLSDRSRRIDFPVGVAYGTSPEKVAEVLLGVARANAYVLPDPEPAVFFLGFGDSALRFELRVWTDRFDRWGQTQSELFVASYAALREAAIDIPYPQREIRVRKE